MTSLSIQPDLRVPVDGAEIAATRYSSGNDGARPAVLVATPYRKDDRITYGGWQPSIEYIATHGYDVVVADVVGTGASTGRPRPFSRTEGDQLAGVVDWLAARPWTTDRVGMFGLSYGAWTQFATAAAAPDALAAIVPVSVTPSTYDSSCPGGVFNPLKRAVWTTEQAARQALPPSRRDTDGRWANIWRDRLDALPEEEPWLFRFLSHEQHGPFWAERAVDPAEITVPTFAACGYRDVHTGPMVEFFGDIDAPKRLLLGPWRHTMPERGREVAVDFRRQAVEWFDHFLKDEENAATDHPTVTYWTERDGGWTVGAGTWRAAADWPDATSDSTAETVTYVVTPDSLVPAADACGSVEHEYTYDHTVGIDSLERVGSIVNPGVDTNADDARSVTAETPSLEDAVEWTGTGRATVHLRATTADPLVAVRVADVATDGTALPVTSGYRLANHRERDAPEPPAPGEETVVDVRLKPKSHVFEVGHRIRFAIAAAAFPQALPPADQGAFTVVSRPDARTGVRFPGAVHETVSFDDTTAVAPPDDSVPVDSPYVTESTGTWETTRRHTEDAARFAASQASTVTLPNGVDMTRRTDIEASVVADDPGSASLHTDVTMTLTYPTEAVRVDASSRVTRTTASLSTRVTVDDETVFDERWRR